MATKHPDTRRDGRVRFQPGLSTMTLFGLAAGVGCGLFFGDYCAKLSIIGDVFIGLLRMTVLPYIVVSLLANLGRLSHRQGWRLAGVGTVVLLLLWGTVLGTIVILASSFPEWKAGSFFSTSLVEPPPKIDILSMFIPANIFAALAENQVPAVVLLCIFAGLSLGRLDNRQQLISQLDILAKVLIRVSAQVARLAPLGVFAISAATAGTISLAEIGRLQAYVVAYAMGALLLGFIVLPGLVAACTPFRYREVLAVSRDSMIMAFATGKLIIVLPILIEQTNRLVERFREDYDGTAIPAVDVLYPLAYPFPHVGKLLGMLFLPFAAWFLGNEMPWSDYPKLLSGGVFSYFGGPILAIPFLLDLMHLPHDMFQLFLLSGVIGERLGDALGAMHLVAFTLLTTTAFLGKLSLRPASLLKYALVVGIAANLMLVGTRATLRYTTRFVDEKQEIIAHMQLLEQPVESSVFRDPSPNPDPLLPGESILDRIRRRGAIRVGYNEDSLPFAYFNIENDLVGFDVNMAHALARDLDVRIEFVRFSHGTVAEQLRQDHFDVVMSGLVGTLERSEAMRHTEPYMDVTLSLVVPDYRVRDLGSVEAMRRAGRLRIGFVDLSRGFVARIRALVPEAELVELQTNREYFEGATDLDALLISAESGSAYTLLFPNFEVIFPGERKVSLPLFYAIGGNDGTTGDFLNHWVGLRKTDGTVQEYYDYWILGKTGRQSARRWCIVRDVLQWVE